MSLSFCNSLTDVFSSHVNPRKFFSPIKMLYNDLCEPGNLVADCLAGTVLSILLSVSRPSCEIWFICR